MLGHLSDRFGRFWLLAGGFLVLATTALAVPLVERDVPLVFAVLAMGLVLFPLLSVFFAAITEAVGEKARGTGLAFTGVAFFIPASISPSAAGQLADPFSTGAVFYAAAGVALGASVVAARAAPGRTGPDSV